jgi:hypothetical protein
MTTEEADKAWDAALKNPLMEQFSDCKGWTTMPMLVKSKTKGERKMSHKRSLKTKEQDAE